MPPTRPASAPLRMKIREEVAALKRARTLAVAAETFYERGYDRATLEEVAERLGVTKPFIYAHFGSKHELLAEICTLGVRAAADVMDEVLAMELKPSDTLRVFAQRYVGSILAHQKQIAIYTREEKNLEPQAAARIAAMRTAFVGKLAAVLEAGRTEGAFAFEDASMAALAIVGAVSWSTFWYRADGRLDAAQIAAMLTRLIQGLVGASPAAPLARSA